MSADLLPEDCRQLLLQNDSDREQLREQIEHLTHSLDQLDSVLDEIEDDAEDSLTDGEESSATVQPLRRQRTNQGY